MTRPYSSDLRERAMARVAAGETIRVVATALRISPSCVSKWSGRLRATGSVSPGRIGGHKPRVLSGAHADWLRTRMSAAPFTLRGLAAELSERGVKVDYRSVCQSALNSFQVTASKSFHLVSPVSAVSCAV
jgi:putative transposase